MAKDGRFKKVLNGYKIEEVNVYIEQMIDDYQGKLDIRESEAQMLREQLEELLGSVKQIKVEKENIKEELNLELSSMSSQAKAVEEKMTAQLNNLEFEKLQLEKQMSQVELTRVDDTELEDIKAHYNLIVATHEKKIKLLENDYQKSQLEYAEIEMKLKENTVILDSRIKTYQEEIQKLEGELSDKLLNSPDLTDELLEKDAFISELNYAITGKEDLIASLNIERTQLLKQIDDLREDADKSDYKIELERLQQVNLTYSEQHTDLMNDLSNEKVKIKEYMMIEQELKDTNISLREEVTSLEKEKMLLEINLSSSQRHVEHASDQAEDVKLLHLQFNDLKDSFEQSSVLYESKINDLMSDNKNMLQMMSQIDQEKSALKVERDQMTQTLSLQKELSNEAGSIIDEAKEKAEIIVKLALKEAALLEDDALSKAKVIEKTAMKKAMEAEVNSELMMERVKYKVQREEDSYQMMMEDIQGIRQSVVEQLNRYQEELGSVFKTVDNESELIPLVKKYG